MHFDWLVAAPARALVIIDFLDRALRRPPSIRASSARRASCATRSSAAPRARARSSSRTLGDVPAQRCSRSRATSRGRRTSRSTASAASSRRLQQQLADVARPGDARRRSSRRAWRAQSLDATQSAQGRARRPSLKELLATRCATSCRRSCAANDQRMDEVAVDGRDASSTRSRPTTRRSSSRSAPPSTRSCTRRSSSASARASSQVAERLEQVHRGIGEMQTLASDVGSLSRVLNNVKTRGTLRRGAARRACSKQVFTPEQYGKQRRDGSGQRTRASTSRSGCRAGATTTSRCGCRSTASSRARTTSGCSRRRSAPTRPASRLRRGRSRCAFASRRARSARSTSRRRTPPTSRSCSCRPRASTPRRCAGRAGRVAAARPPRHARRADDACWRRLTSLQMGFRHARARAARRPRCWEVLERGQDRVRQFGDVLAKTSRSRTSASQSTRSSEAEARTRVMARALQARRGGCPSCACPDAAAGSWVDNADPATTTRMTEPAAKRRSPAALLALIGGQIALALVHGRRPHGGAACRAAPRATRRGRSACCSACSRRRRSCSRSPPGGSPTATAITGRSESRSALTVVGGMLRGARRPGPGAASFVVLCVARDAHRRRRQLSA